ncbi:hypothetical protein Afil01_39040 [Actinorhabdospora filicis]|uniref:Uncharacterized protein n=1 Tax=Actinorhabdospora filicis TaxID=1785913 RepID=A0A9W6SNP1_9ACTN|nr:hypothetical protein Afil01_39040 [Actinorhabdospora filicis]
MNPYRTVWTTSGLATTDLMRARRLTGASFAGAALSVSMVLSLSRGSVFAMSGEVTAVSSDTDALLSAAPGSHGFVTGEWVQGYAGMGMV